MNYTNQIQTKEMQDLREKLREVKKEILGTEFKNNSPLKITNYTDNVKRLFKIQPFFYDKAKIYWIWNKEDFYWEMVDETDVLIMIDKQLHFGGELITQKIKNNYLEAFKQVGRSKMPKEFPNTWIQFKDKFVDLKNQQVHEATPEYFCCNPIPWAIGESDQTPVMDKLFEEWVGKDYVKTLYELIAYCCVTDYPISLIFCLVGAGRNGKSKYQTLVNNFIGNSNICSTELDLLIDNRFESAKLYKKLVCLLGETNFGVMKKTSLLKKLSGGDMIGFEFKNKNPFDALNYAKIIISSNSLPTSEDTSEGFYRRWNIIDFPNEFPEGKDILATIPELEYNNLCRKVIRYLPLLLEKGKFNKQGSIEERKKKYMLASNPIETFLSLCCDEKEGDYVKSSDLYNAYVTFLRKIKNRIVTRKEYNIALSEQGFYANRTSKRVQSFQNDLEDKFESTYWVDGLQLKANIKEILENMNRNEIFM